MRMIGDYTTSVLVEQYEYLPMFRGQRASFPVDVGR